ncbi:GGDEF domain-containing protein [Clostridiales bacterium COT073_COT-073]|nr:GGDEF domain-containing protein [Clostridiales bacterium COT073_COT-073]
MKSQEILQLSGSGLYSQFIEWVISNVFESEKVVSELEQSERYTCDVIFRIHVQTARQYILVSNRNYEEVVEKAEDIIERAFVLELPEILNLNYHILGISCKLLGYFERAMECFMNVLKYERIYGFKHLTSIVYFYIGELYMLHDDFEPAIDYLNLALKVLEETKDIEPRYNMKKVMFTSVMFQLLFETKKYEEMDQHIEVLSKYAAMDSNPTGVYTYKLALLFFHAAHKEFEQGKKVFYEILELCGDDADAKLQQIKIYCALLWEYDLDPAFYEQELLMAETLGESRLNFTNYALNKYLYEYYEKMGNRDLAFQYLGRSFKSIESEMDQLKRNQTNSFRLIEKNFSMEEDISLEQKKNNELKLITKEALKNKKVAESALHRLAVVGELGKKLTYSLGVQDIVNTVYSKLINSIPLESFILMIKNSELNQLQSLVFYENGKLADKMVIDYEDEDSAFVETFRTNRFIRINDFNKNVRFSKQRENNPEDYCRSVLFLPLSIENEVLGVCSVQHSQPDIYQQEDIDFLEELMPYLAIALNNAFKSEALEKEIRHHEETQSELRQVNHKLEALSYLDGLTQISNRRDFENRILDYIDKAREQALALSIFMFDIDFFKYFNDSYGHLEGDNALKSVAMIVQKHFDEIGGISARFGGEEFVAACLGLDEKQSMALGNEIKEAVFGLAIANEKAPLGRLSISVGIAHSSGGDDLKKSSMMRWADVSLYQAKRTGKNKVVLKVVAANEESPEGYV